MCVSSRSVCPEPAQLKNQPNLKQETTVFQPLDRSRSAETAPPLPQLSYSLDHTWPPLQLQHLSATVQITDESSVCHSSDNSCMLGNVSQAPLDFCRAHISPGTARCKFRISLSAQKWWAVNGTARCKFRISLSAQKWPVNGIASCKFRISLSAPKCWPVNGPTT